MILPGDIDRCRARLIELHYRAQAGHLGGSLSCIDALVVLFSSVLKEEDAFILSKGHSASALYVALWNAGLIDGDTLDTFCQDGTKLGGHPPMSGLPGVLFGTGSLGHGFSLASGIALGKKFAAQEGRVFCLCSDGEFQEGSIWEAVLFSMHHKLDNLVVLVDVNGWQGFGSTANVASVDLNGLKDRLLAFGICVDCCDGHDAAALTVELNAARISSVPRVLLMETCKGKGAPCFEGQFVSHYGKLTKEQFDEAIDSLGCFE